MNYELLLFETRYAAALRSRAGCRDISPQSSCVVRRNLVIAPFRTKKHTTPQRLLLFLD
jgi:hypothetical protein